MILFPQIGIGIIWNYHGNQQLTNGMSDARRKAQKTSIRAQGRGEPSATSRNQRNATTDGTDGTDKKRQVSYP
jgi:hypothetical protein